MANEYDIQPLAASLLAGTRQRKDDQFAQYNQERDRLDRRRRDREKRDLKHLLAAKLVMGIGNTMLKSKTEAFMQKKEVLDNNIKFKNALAGASDRFNHRSQAATHEGGATEYYRSLASKELLPNFNQLVPTSYNEEQRQQLLFNESTKAGLVIQKSYEESRDADQNLLERVGKNGSSAYTDALRAAQPKNIGEGLFQGFRNLFRDEKKDAMDRSFQGTAILDSASKVKAYGHYRAEGLSPWNAKEKLQELALAGSKLDVSVVSSEVTKEIVFDIRTGKNEEHSIRNTVYGDGTQSRVDITAGTQAVAGEISKSLAIGNLLTNNPKEVEMFTVEVQSILPEEDIQELAKYAESILGSSTDKDRITNTGNYVYGGVMLTRNSLTRLQVKPTQAAQLSAKMHSLNADIMMSDGWGSTYSPQNTVLVGERAFHPHLAIIALEDIEKKSGQTSKYPPSIKAKLFSAYEQNVDYYESLISDAGQLKLDGLLKDSKFFNSKAASNESDVQRLQREAAERAEIARVIEEKKKKRKKEKRFSAL